MQDSFGWGFRGNFQQYYEPFFGGETFQSDEQLGIIARKLGPFLQIRGTLEDNGQKVRVKARHLEMARKYAQLYEDKFGSTVTIEVLR